MKSVAFLCCLLLTFSLAHAQRGGGVSLHPKAARKPVSSRTVQRRSRSSRKISRQNLRALYQSRTVPEEGEEYFVTAEKPTIFRVQRHENSVLPASAFAIEVDGHLFGVTAGHVIYTSAKIEERKRIEHQRAMGRDIPEFVHFPFARFYKGNGQFLTTEIKSWQLSNIFGADVAVFEIPEEARPYVKPLPVSATRVKPYDVAKLSGYIADQTFNFPTEEVLISNPYRMLLRNNSDRPTTGMCGSPVMINDKVVGIYVGFLSQKDISKMIFTSLTRHVRKEGEEMPEVHFVAPISLITPLVHKMLGKESPQDGMALKAAGYDVAVLLPEERVSSVELFRNNEKLQAVSAQELTNPEHLDQFFEIQPDDILRVNISHSSDGSETDRTFFYELNVSTGEVTRHDNSEE